MPFACSYEVPADEHLYRRVKHEIGDEPAKGLVAHLVVKSAGGLRHIGVWDSQDDWYRFREERVRPAVGRVLATAGRAQPTPAPEEQILDVVDVILRP